MDLVTLLLAAAAVVLIAVGLCWYTNRRSKSGGRSRGRGGPRGRQTK